MAIKDNIFYWEESLKNPESLIDEYYIADEIILSKDFIDKVDNLRQLITDYCNKNDDHILDMIYNIIISVDKIQYTEFISYWKPLGMTKSIFEKLSKEEQKEFLKYSIEKYCENRIKLYKGKYSDIIMQALYDSSASRKQGKSGINKLIEIMKNCFNNEVKKIVKIEDFHNFKIAYLLADKGGEKVYEKLINYLNLSNTFRKNMQNKNPDILLKFNNEIFIIEAKHVKEAGGEQSKSVNELINFIKQESEKSSVHYVSFMDGIYFNLFCNISEKSPNNKIKTQKQDIEETLKLHKNNFFVNTKGFEKLLRDLIQS